VEHRPVAEAINAAVDIRSRIIIQFDREWMLQQGPKLDVALTVLAQVKGASEVRNIEVPGYSLVGKELGTATARIQSATSLLRLVGEVKHSFPPSFYTFGDSLGTAHRDTTNAALLTVRGDVRSQAPLLHSVFRRLSDSTAIDIVEGIARLLGRDAVVLQKHAHEADSLVGRMSETEDLKENLAAISVLYKFVAAFDNIPSADDLLNAQRWIEDSASEITHSEGARRAEILNWIRGSRVTLNRRQLQEDFLSRYFLASLKDSDLLVATTGAKVGEDILLTFYNNPEDKERLRSLTLRFEVHRFGLVQKTTDALLMVKRNGISKAGNQDSIDVATAGVATSGVSRTLTLQEPVQFSPSGGATFGWYYYSRRSAALRFLTPGFGLSVLFPRFPEKTVVITPSNPGEQPVVDVTVSDGIDVGAGLVASLFENAVQFTYGWNLTSGAPRSYWGVGFSFGGIADKLGVTNKQSGQ